MHKRDIEFFALDMLLSIERIKRYAGPLKDVDDFICDEVAVNLILRDLTIVGEAMNHILKAKEFYDFLQPKWRTIVDFRNIVVHEYFGLSYDEIFIIIKEEIPELENELIELLEKIGNKKKLMLAISDLNKELKEMQRRESLSYLLKLEKLLRKS